MQVVIATILGTAGYYLISSVLHVGTFATLFITAMVFFGVYAVVLLVFRYEMLIELLNMMCNPILKKLKKVNQ